VGVGSQRRRSSRGHWAIEKQAALGLGRPRRPPHTAPPRGRPGTRIASRAWSVGVGPPGSRGMVVLVRDWVKMFEDDALGPRKAACVLTARWSTVFSGACWIPEKARAGFCFFCFSGSTSMWSGPGPGPASWKGDVLEKFSGGAGGRRDAVVDQLWAPRPESSSGGINIWRAGARTGTKLVTGCG